MSTWNDERHEAARARCEAATEGPWEAQPDRTGTATIVLDQEGYALWDVLGTLLDKDGEFIAHARIDLAEALDEIDRLRAQVDRQGAVIRSLTEELASGQVQVTNDMVTAARKTMDDHWAIPLPYSWACECGMTVEGTDGHAQAVILSHIARTGLEAALSTKEEA